MAQWDKITSRGNVEDRRAAGPVAIGGGVGIVGLVIYLLMNFLGGSQPDVGEVLNQLQNVQVQNNQNYNAKDFEGADSYEVFASTVLGSTNDMWNDVFKKSSLTYTEPKLVLFRGSTNSACGGADSSVGPHYCPNDNTIYLDETFFDELTKRFGGNAEDVAQAYVIAHEVGHNVQNQLGDMSQVDTQEESIHLELQADCYAGLWASSIKSLGVFEPNEITEALNEAAAVGDDRIQSKIEGRVDPENWTHGSSEQRVSAFTKGYTSGSVQMCEI